MDYDPSDSPGYYYEGTSIQPETVKRSKRPRYFPSNKPQTFIKNAVTGVPYPFLVGSKEQKILYKIVDATGTCDTEGFVIKDRKDLPNSQTNHLFYDSPEQCMNHLRLTINVEDIRRWKESNSEPQF